MKTQRGGAFRVSGYIALALLALAVLEAVQIRYLFAHRKIKISLPATLVRPNTDYGVVHIFPPTRTVCTFADTICSTTT